MASDGEISCTNDPNFAVIYSFLKVFGKLCPLEVPSIVKLQELIENTQEVLEPLKELHLRLLRRALKSVQSNRWEKALIKFCHQHGHHQEAWEIERFSYKKASTPVKLKVLKFLLEYQFTCHSKFKTAVNDIPCKDLRLDPIGRDKNGCVYWLQIDDDANLCLYKEDQDEETWQLVARNREELVKVIDRLKNGEDVCPTTSQVNNEDSNSAEVPSEIKDEKSVTEDNEEFLSPESESENDNEEPEKQTQNIHPEVKEETYDSKDMKTEKIVEPEADKGEESKKEAIEDDNLSEGDNIEDEEIEEAKTDDINETENQNISESKMKEMPVTESEEISTLEPNDINPENDKVKEVITEISKESDEIVTTEKEKADFDSIEIENKDKEKDDSEVDKEVVTDVSDTEEVGEAIEEPVMIVTGEGNGEDCESAYFIGEEIEEPVMYFYGEGCGYSNYTGNPETVEQSQSAEENSEAENDNEDCLNGEHVKKLSNPITNSKKAKTLKNKLPAVNKRSLKKQSTDNQETLKSDPKKHCIRDVNKPNSSNSTSNQDNKHESSLNDKSTDNEGLIKNSIKKGRTKFKKKIVPKNKILKEDIEVSKSELETNEKISIIEKRKNSISSDEEDVPEKESSEKEVKQEESLPSKKLRLETTPESDAVHSKDNLSVDKTNCDSKNENSDSEKEITPRKKIKAKKGRFKRKNFGKSTKGQTNDSIGKDIGVVSKSSKAVKRSLLDANQSDKSRSESQSESDEEEPVTSGKRLKIKPKKIVKSVRKKVEAKVLENKSSDESEDETLYSLASVKKSKEVLKKKPKGKSKEDKTKVKSKECSDDDDIPVRQSRRIAQMKIKEEADRRHLEEVALREMKMIHKKTKNKDDEEDWKASDASSSEAEVRKKKPGKVWKPSDSTGPESHSESDEPLFEHVEPDLDLNPKSDHEFSPESDLESGEPVEPVKMARTLQQDKESGFCKRCGSGEQPEWILLCDSCDAGYHASCLKPLLLLVPEGDWFCPPCNHEKLISRLESELVKYDELYAAVEVEREKKRLEDIKKKEKEEETSERDKEKQDSDNSQSDSSGSWSSSSGAVYRLRARRQLPVSYRSQEYDRLISSAIKEEYVEPTCSAGNQGRGKDISTIIEAAEEEKLKAEREAIEQGKPIEIKKPKRKQRRKPRKLNSLEVPSEDDDETDEDFKDTGMESSSESISSSAEREGSTGSRSSDDLPRRAHRHRRDRLKLVESSPEVKKKKKGVFNETSEESSGAKEWRKKSKKSKSSSKSHHRSSKKPRRKPGLTQYDSEGNVIRARVTYGGLSGDEPNDWSPKHRTRQKKINYTEMPNTESEDEMHKSSGKHMPDSSDEFKIDDSELESSDSESRRKKKEEAEEQKRALSDLITKNVVVPLEKLPEHVARAKAEQLEQRLTQAELQPAVTPSRPMRGRGSRGGGRGSRGYRGGGCGGPAGTPGMGRGRGMVRGDDALASLVGVKIKDLSADSAPPKPYQAEREKKRLEREAKQAEKEARRVERLQKKEEKEKLKEQKAKEREEKKLAKIALQESKRIKKENQMGSMGYGHIRPLGSGPDAPRGNMFPGGGTPRAPGDFPEQQRFPPPRLQVRPELRGVSVDEHRLVQRPRAPLREGTLSVAGSPQPFKPAAEEPSVITRMPHMLNQQYRAGMMYPGNGPYARGQGFPGGAGYPPYYPHVRAVTYPPGQHPRPAGHSGPSSSPTPNSSGIHPHPGLPHGHNQYESRPQMPSRAILGPPASSPGPIHPGMRMVGIRPEMGLRPPHPDLRPHHPGDLRPHHPDLRAPHPGELRPPHPELRAPHPGDLRSHHPGDLRHSGDLRHPNPNDLRHPHPGDIRHPHLGDLRHPHPGDLRHPHPGDLRHPHPGDMRHPHPGDLRHPHPGDIRHPHPGDLRHPHPSDLPPGVRLAHPGDPTLLRPSHPDLPPGILRSMYPGDMPPGVLRPPHPEMQMRPTNPGELPPGLIRNHPGMPGMPRPPSSNASPGPPGTPNSNAGSNPSPGVPIRLAGLADPGGHGQPNGVPTTAPPGPSAQANASASNPPDTNPEPLIKIKAEVKTEPEYHSPGQSPSHRPLSPQEPPRNHPKIKVTENKDRRPRFPLGPYAPQYGPYGPYAPTTQTDPIMNLQSRAGPINPSPLQRMHNIHQFLPSSHLEKPEQSRSPIQRPPPHLVPPEMQSHHYMQMQQHIRPPIRPYGLPVMHDRPAPQMPPHYGPYAPDIHRPEKPPIREPVLQNMTKPPSPRSEEDNRRSPNYRSPPTNLQPAPPGLQIVPPPTTLQAIPPTTIIQQIGPENLHKPAQQTLERIRPDNAEESRGSTDENSKLTPTDDDDDVNKDEEDIKPSIKVEQEVPPREEGSVFGGLVSYFSSQQDDLDA